MNKFIKILLILMAVFTVIGMIFILSVVNFKLLLWLNWYNISSGIDQFIAIVSGFIFATGSIVVIIWYNPKFLSGSEKNINMRIIASILLKVVFVSMDGIHIMIFFNNNMSTESMNKIASTVYGIQTMLILLFIGSVIEKIIRNGQQKEEDKTEIENIKTVIASKQSDINNLSYRIKSLLEAQETYKTKIKEQRSQIKDRDEHIQFLEKNFFLNERSRILKKKEENRTPEEVNILQESEKFI